MLDCAVLDATTNSSLYGAARAPTCFVRRMPGLAFNPAVVRAPAWLVNSAASAGLPGVVYAATHRIGFMNRGSCSNDATTLNGKRFDIDGSELLLLGAAFDVLLKTPIAGGACLASDVTDARPLVMGAGVRGEAQEGARLFVTYTTFFDDMHISPNRNASARLLSSRVASPHPQLESSWSCSADAQSGESKTWIAPLQVNFSQGGGYGGYGGGGGGGGGVAGGASMTAQLQGTERHWGQNLNGTAGMPLVSKRNPGVIVDHDGNAALELSETSPAFEWTTASGERVTRVGAPSFSPEMRNSIHPIWSERLGGYLGVAHRHLSTGWQTEGAPFLYGYDYHFVLYALTRDLKLTRHSAEFMFPSLDTTDDAMRGAESGGGGGGGGVPRAEGVQFVMSAVWVGADEARLALTYGVNDCESAVWQATFAEVDAMLEFHA